MNRALRTGLRFLFGGMRAGQVPTTAVGMALTAVGLLRRGSRPRKELIWARNLRPGETVQIKYVVEDGSE